MAPVSLLASCSASAERPFSLAVATFTALVFGLVPLSHLAKDRVGQALKDSAGRSSSGSRRTRLRSALVVGEVALAVLLVPTYVDHARVLDRGDSTHYYSYLRSLLFDGDLDLANDYALLGWPEVAALPNVLPVGAPLMWSPLVVPVHLLRQAARVFGAGPPDGTEPLYQATVAFSTLLYGTAGLFLLMGALRRWVSPWAAFWATVITWVGSPVRFYLSVLPGTAHGVEFFAAVLVLRAAIACHNGMATFAEAGVSGG